MSFYASIDSNFQRTLYSMENFIRSKTGHKNYRKNYESVTTQHAFKGTQKEKARIVSSDQDLSVVKPLYYTHKNRNYCDKTNCRCQFHRMKKSGQVSEHHYSKLKKKENKMVKTIRQIFEQDSHVDQCSNTNTKTKNSLIHSTKRLDKIREN